MRDMESSFHGERVQQFEGHVQIKTETDLPSQPELHLEVKSEVEEDVKKNYTFEQGSTSIQYLSVEFIFNLD